MQVKKHPRILLVDDDQLTQVSYCSMLADEFWVDVVGSGEQALAQCVYGYDAIVLDVYLPDMSGIEVARRIRDQDTVVGKTPIIGVTVDTSTAIKLQCLEVGMDDFFAKPVDAEKIKQAIRKLALKPKWFEVSTRLGKIYLTQRELECALKMAQGKTEAVIADELQVARTTVGFYICNLQVKLGVSSERELVDLLLSDGFFQ